MYMIVNGGGQGCKVACKVNMFNHVLLHFQSLLLYSFLFAYFCSCVMMRRSGFMGHTQFQQHANVFINELIVDDPSDFPCGNDLLVA